MNALEKAKAATAQLSADEQVELFRWWTESDTFRQHQLAALQRDLAAGLEDLGRGRYQTYSDSNLMQLAEDIANAGRGRLKKQSA